MLLFSLAFALDCETLDPEVCSTVDAIAASLASQTGSPVIHPGAPGRLRPETVYDRLLEVAEQVRAQGGSLDGFFAGRYDMGSGRWTGDSDGGVGAGTFLNPSRVYKQRPEKYGMRYPAPLPLASGDSGGVPVGASFGGHTTQGRLLADDGGDGVWAGYYVRTSGQKGVHFGVRTSALGTAPLEAMRDWYGDGAVGHESRRLQGAVDVAPGVALGSLEVGAPFGDDLDTVELVFGEGDERVFETVVVGGPSAFSATRRPGVFFFPSSTRVHARTASGEELGVFECAFEAGARTCSGLGPDGSDVTVSFSDDPNDSFVRVQGAVADPTSTADWFEVVLLQDDGTEQTFSLVATYATTVPVDLSAVEAICPGWTCGALPWRASIRGAHGFVVGTTGGVLEMQAQFGEILIDGVVWELE